MTGKTLQQMTKAELLNFINLHQNSLDNITHITIESQKILSEVATVHKNLLVGDKENTAVVANIENIFNEAKSNEKTIAGLLSGATTISLTREFSKRVDEYRQIRLFWEILSVVTFIGCLCASAFYLLPLQPENPTELYLYFVRVFPFFIIVIWAITFMLNRRSENKILEESYKHKETVAKMFEGYKSSAMEIDPKGHYRLQSTLMQGLFDAIRKDSSAFLTTKSDKYPTSEVIEQLIYKAGRNPHGG